jgi:D-3-phosphoglycerate dehydrogenase
LKNKSNRVVIIDGGYPDYRAEIELLTEHGYEVAVFEGGRLAREEKIAFSKEALGIFVRWTVMDQSFFEKMSQLKAVVRYGVGYDNIDLKAATSYGVKVSNVQGYANHSVSDHALGLMFSCVRALPLAPIAFREKFTNPPRKDIFEFFDKTLGIIGLGRIGGTLCSKAKHLFRKVLAADPYIPDQRFRNLGATKATLDELLAESHVISLHCNLTPETTRLIDQSAFQKMGQRPVLINTARGTVIDEDALQNALNQDIIHSAGLDVFCDEPPLENRKGLVEHPRVICTGHYAWYSDTAFRELRRRAAENMLMLLEGKILEECLNP